MDLCEAIDRPRKPICERTDKVQVHEWYQANCNTDASVCTKVSEYDLASFRCRRGPPRNESASRCLDGRVARQGKNRTIHVW